MTLDYYLHDKVKITMFHYIESFLSRIPSSLKGDSVTAAPNHLFEVGDDSPMLHPKNSNIYYHQGMHLLWLAKRRVVPDHEEKIYLVDIKFTC